ncbi:DEAD/DEAH box helicase family protein [Kingella kingae]|nr:DEAD/DEAH box helicase family protein [Kingella kingae]MDK4530925.1 DEAD/DEAH box helicase family protein [Kingella kingae]MDK4581340.1 DEAD/DEAH box helicase family protein [Kingella kingae]
MSNPTDIKTVKLIYPQIYAYRLPEMPDKNGWIKIGYTERENADERIKEQTHTAAVRLNYDKLWAAPAKFRDSDEWFKDKQLHAYLRKIKHIQQAEDKSEWFYYNGNPEHAQRHFQDFIQRDYSQEYAKNDDYQLREEQREAVAQTLAYFQENPNGKFLWNAKPRFGKTLTTYDLARELKTTKVLIVTNRPAIANSWFDDFEKFIA